MTNFITNNISSITSIIVSIAVIIATYKAFQKANEKGWKALIPFYNAYTEYKLVWETKHFWKMLASVSAAVIFGVATKLMAPGFGTLVAALISLAAVIVATVISIKKDFKLAEAFGHTKKFGLGLVFLEPIFRMILGFGKSEYTRA